MILLEIWLISCSFYKVELSELVSADTFVLSLSATDRDSGFNGKVTYRLLSSPLQGFYIQPDNGKNSSTDGKNTLQWLWYKCLIDSKLLVCVCLYI